MEGRQIDDFLRAPAQARPRRTHPSVNPCALCYHCTHVINASVSICVAIFRREYMQEDGTAVQLDFAGPSWARSGVGPLRTA